MSILKISKKQQDSDQRAATVFHKMMSKTNEKKKIIKQMQDGNSF